MFYLTKQDQEERFEEQCSFDRHNFNYFRNVGNLFPFVTLPDLELKGTNTRDISGDTSIICWIPYVTGGIGKINGNPMLRRIGFYI